MESPKCLLGDIDFSLGATLSIQQTHYRNRGANGHQQIAFCKESTRNLFFPTHFNSEPSKFFIFRIPCPCKFVRTEHREICFCMVSAFEKKKSHGTSRCVWRGAHVYSPDVEQTNGGFLKWWYPTTIGFPTKK